VTSRCSDAAVQRCSGSGARYRGFRLQAAAPRSRSPAIPLPAATRAAAPQHPQLPESAACVVRGSNTARKEAACPLLPLIRRTVAVAVAVAVRIDLDNDEALVPLTSKNRVQDPGTSRSKDLTTSNDVEKHPGIGAVRGPGRQGWQSFQSGVYASAAIVLRPRRGSVGRPRHCGRSGESSCGFVHLSAHRAGLISHLILVGRAQRRQGRSIAHLGFSRRGVMAAVSFDPLSLSRARRIPASPRAL
jgi:hypothetical protein